MAEVGKPQLIRGFQLAFLLVSLPRCPSSTPRIPSSVPPQHSQFQGFKEKDPRKKFPKNRRRSGSKNRILFPSHPRCSRSVPTATLQSGKKNQKKKPGKEKEIQRVGSGKRGNSGIKTVKSQEGIFSREKLLSRPHPPHPQALVSSSGPAPPLEKRRIPVIWGAAHSQFSRNSIFHGIEVVFP